MELTTQERMTSLQISEITGKQHSNILRDIRSLIEQGVAEFNFELGSYKDKNNQDRTMCLLTKKGCLILASGYDAVLREKIVNRLEELEKKFSLPDSYETALEHLLIAVKENKQLAIENTEMKPKAEFYDAVTGSDTICDIGTVAKVLDMGIGRNKLFDILRNKKIFQPNNQPYQRYCDEGKFKIVETKYQKPNGDIQIYFKTMVTQKGVDYIRKQLTKGA